MQNKLLHTRKTHLIEHVSDDIRAMRQSDVELQKTLLTGRALKDVLSGDTVSLNNASDAVYFSGTKFDFDLMIDPSIRFVKGGNSSGSYSNGPLEGTVNEKFGDAIVHTFTVLADGKLSYTGDTDGERVVDGEVVKPESIRQVFYPTDPTDLDAYTRVGNWNGDTEEYEWTGWISLSGRSLRILVKGGYEVEEAILSNLLPYTIYEMHCGGHEVTLPDADELILSSNITFEQYANTNYSFTVVDKSVTPTPDKNQKYYTRQADGTGYIYVRAGNNGVIGSFAANTEYYTRDPITQWVNTVKYTEKAKDYSGTGAVRDAEYTTTLLPSMDTTRADAYNSPLESNDYYEDAHECVQYRFEVIDRDSSFTYIKNGATVTTKRTWILDVQSEAIDALEGFAELLNAHTDMNVPDIIQYDKRGFIGGSTTGFTADQVAAFDVQNAGGTLVIARPTNMRGVARITFSLSGVPSDTDNFSMSVYKYNEYDGDFDPTQVSLTFVADNSAVYGASVNQYKKYYTYNEITGYTLVDGTGRPEAFAQNVTYYTKVFAPTGTLPVARCRVNGQFRAAVFGGVSTTNVQTSYTENGIRQSYAPVSRSSLGSVATEAFIDVARNDVIMVVIKSNNHDTSKAIYAPTLEFYPDPHDSYIPKTSINSTAFTNADLNNASLACSTEDSVPSSKVLTTAYEMLATPLQGKGLLFGHRNDATGNLDQVTDPGIYTIQSQSGDSKIHSDYHTSSGTVFEGGTLVVFNTKKSYSPNILKKPDTADATNYQTVQVVFGYSNQTTGASAVGEIWWRIKLSPTATWTPWARLGTAQAVSSEFTSEVSSNSVESLLAAGEAIVVVKPITAHTEGSEPIRVNLPDPAYHKGSKMQIEAVNCKVNIAYSKGGVDYTYSGTNIKDRMLYPLECDGVYWYVITVS